MWYKENRKKGRWMTPTSNDASEKDKHEFIHFEGKLKVIFSMPAPDIYSILLGEKPTSTERGNLGK